MHKLLCGPEYDYKLLVHGRIEVTPFEVLSLLHALVYGFKDALRFPFNSAHTLKPWAWLKTAHSTWIGTQVVKRTNCYSLGAYGRA